MIFLRVFHYTIIFLLLSSIKAFSLEKCNEAFSPQEDKKAMAVFIQNIYYDLNFSPGVKNVLDRSEIYYLGDLVTKTRKELLKVHGLGMRKINQIEKELSKINLYLGMNINWPSDPKQVEGFVKTLTPKVELTPILVRPIESLNISHGPEQALKRAEIYYLGNLVTKKETELLALNGFSETGLDEVKFQLSALKLSLRMFIDWPSDSKQIKILIETLKLKEEPNPLLAHSIKSRDFFSEIEDMLQKNEIHYLGDLTTKREDELLALPGFEQSFLPEIESLLSKMGLSLRMNADWPSDPKQVKALMDKLNPKVELTAIFIRLVQNLNLRTDIKKVLKEGGIIYIGDLVTKTKLGLLRKVPGLGKKRISKVKAALSKIDLHFGMNIDWPSDPMQIEALVKRLNSEKEFNPLFTRPINTLNLSDKTKYVLMREGILYIGDLVVKAQSELLEVLYFGEKKLTEVETTLAKIGLSLAMNIDWPPNPNQLEPITEK